MHYPKGQGYNDDYFLQLTAEVLKTKRVRGVVVSNYEKIRDRNEALDIRVYGIALVDILKPNLTAIAKKQKPESDPGSTSSEALPPKEAKEYILDPEKKFDPRPEQKPETSNPKPPLKQARPPRPPRRPGGGWISGWKK
jgi:phage terminase large subunit GpA-like protein